MAPKSLALLKYKAAGKFKAKHGHLLNFKHLCNRTLLKGKLILVDPQAFSNPNTRNANFKRLIFIYENVFFIVKMLIITAKDNFYQIFFFLKKEEMLSLASGEPQLCHLLMTRIRQSI